MRKLILLLAVAALLLAACGGGEKKEEKEEPAPAVSSGDAARGEQLFKQTVIGSQPGCTTCHSLEHDKVLVGPSLAGVAEHAAEHAEGMSVAEYLRQSILEPDAFVVEGFAANVMPAGFADELTSQQVDDLVAFLLTLE